MLDAITWKFANLTDLMIDFFITFTANQEEKWVVLYQICYQHQQTEVVLWKYEKKHPLSQRIKQLQIYIASGMKQNLEPE